MDGKDKLIRRRLNKHMAVLTNFDLDHYRLRIIEVPIRDHLQTKVVGDEILWEQDALNAAKARREKLNGEILDYLKSKKRRFKSADGSI